MEELTPEYEEIGFTTSSGHKIIPGPDRTHWSQILAWSMYDLANTIFSLAVVSLTIASYVVILGIHQGFEESMARLIFSIFVGLGNVIVAFLLPVIGIYSDRSPSRKRPLVIITLFTIGATAGLGFTREFWSTLVFFLIANVCYQLSLVIYDNMIPYISTREDVGKVSAFGVALGYFGSFVGLGISMALLALGMPDISLEEREIGYAPTLYPLVALAFLILAIPILWVKEYVRVEPPVQNEEELRTILKTPPTKELVSMGLTQLYTTVKEIYNKHREMLTYVIGWLIYVEAANTIILFMGDLLRDMLLLPTGWDLYVLGLGILFAVLLTYPVGVITERIGPKKGFKLITVLWLFSFFFGFFVNMPGGPIRIPQWGIFFMALFIGPALGGGWVVNRQYVLELSPPGDTGKYFGLTQVGARASAAIGPLIWTLSIWVSESIFDWKGNRPYSFRFALLVIAALLILGQFIISRVGDYHEQYLTRTRPWDIDPSKFKYDV